MKPVPLELNQQDTDPIPDHLTIYQKDQWEANAIASGQYPTYNAPAAEKKAAGNPKLIAVWVIAGIAVLLLTFCVVKALMYRSKHGGYWW